jgi:formate C-acetyltransferase
MGSQAGTPTYQQRIDALRQTKAEHTAIKVDRFGHFDTDDHGYIPWDESISFEAVPSHPSGGCWGIAAIGASFKRWLEVYPVYIHPMSSLTGAWVRTPGQRGTGIPGVGRGPRPRSGGNGRGQHAQPVGVPGSWKPEDRVHHLTKYFERYNVYHTGIGSANHLSPDMSIGLTLGWGGLLQKVRHYRDLNRPADTSFYDGEEALILGVLHWIRRHADRAREMAERETNPVLRENLLAMAEANEWLVEGAPRTLREACQFLAWFQCVDRMWALGGALGQLDELLRPYYEADLAAGRETDESVIWHLASLFFNDPHYSQIGGQAPDGRDLTSPMSFLVLEAMHRLRTPSNLALRVHEGMDRGLLRRAVQNICEDGTGVAFACSKGLDEGFMRNGHPPGLARMRAKVGCNWTALPGIEYCLQDVTRVCLVTPLLVALGEVVACVPGERTMEALWERYAAHLGVSVGAVKEGKALHMERQADNWPEIVLNLFCHGPVERGLDASAGGVDIVDLAMDGIGLATVADSFAAIEQRVVREGRLTWRALVEHLENDFEGAEPARLMLHSIPRYGAGGTRADHWAHEVASLWEHLVRDTPTRNGFTCIPGLFSHGGTSRYGARVGATPNGRHAGEPLSHSADPDPGFLPGGGLAVTAKSTAVASVQPRWGNTTPLQIELDQRLVQGLGGLEAVESLILSHNTQGGTLINLNVLSKQQILEAHEDPMRHPDLVIRVTGYSAYFRSLSREYRQPIVDRILAEG